MIKIEPYSEDMYEDVVRIFAKARVNDRLILAKILKRQYNYILKIM